MEHRFLKDEVSAKKNNQAGRKTTYGAKQKIGGCFLNIWTSAEYLDKRWAVNLWKLLAMNSNASPTPLGQSKK